VITVIGSINLDLIARVQRLPAPGETVPGDGFSTAPGGKGANQALAAARAGASVRMVGAVGSDPFAAQATELLRSGGVDLGGVRLTPYATGVALILVGDDGENVIAIVPGANQEVDAAAVEAATLQRGEHVLLQHEVPLATVEAALDAARQAGAVTILNTAPFRREAAGLLNKSNYVVANETEFDLYAEELGLPGEDRVDRPHGQLGGRRDVLELGGFEPIRGEDPLGRFEDVLAIDVIPRLARLLPRRSHFWNPIT